MESWQRRRMVVETFACAEKIGVKADSLNGGASAAFDLGCSMFASELYTKHRTPNIERPTSKAKASAGEGNRTLVARVACFGGCH